MAKNTETNNEIELIHSEAEYIYSAFFSLIEKGKQYNVDASYIAALEKVKESLSNAETIYKNLQVN